VQGGGQPENALLNVSILFTLLDMLDDLAPMKPGQLLARGVCRHLLSHDFVTD
jgi:hypothetical protein